MAPPIVIETSELDDDACRSLLDGLRAAGVKYEVHGETLRVDPGSADRARVVIRETTGLELDDLLSVGVPGSQSDDGRETTAEDPPAPGWWKALDGGWHPPTEPRPSVTPTPKAGPDLTPAGVAARAASRQRDDTKVGCGALLVIVAIIALIGTCIGDSDDGDGGGGGGGGSGGSDTSLDEITAYNACKSSVNSQLRAPGTSSFPDYYDHDGEVIITGSGSSLSITSHVDAENAFGGEVRTTWVCDATKTGTGWSGTATLIG